MSIYTSWVNKIKTMSTSEWLTTSQKEAFSEILELSENNTFLCLHGQRAVGKTFIAQILVKEQSYSLVSRLEGSEKQELGSYVIVDGEPYHRLMQAEAMVLGLRRVVVVMRRPPREAMPKIEVALTQKDVREFQHNLARYHIIRAFMTERDGRDLKMILRDEAVVRGEKGVY